MGICGGVSTRRCQIRKDKCINAKKNLREQVLFCCMCVVYEKYCARSILRNKMISEMKLEKFFKHATESKIILEKNFTK